MERQTVLMGVSVMVLLALIGFYVGFLYEQPSNNQQNETVMQMNVTVDDEESIKTASFYNHSIDLFHESGMNASFYLDIDQDGSGERQLDIQRTGEEEMLTELVTFDGVDYRLYFRYKDDSTIEEDSYLTLYRVEKLTV
jgi:hypothetical protein